MPRVEQVQQKALEEFRERNRAAAKRKKNKNTQKIGETLITFVCLFFLLSLLFLQVAKRMTPKIDTSIGSNVKNPQVEQLETKESIDDRLKLIQFDDALAANELQKQREKEIFNEELDEKVILPKSKAEEVMTNDEEQNLSEKVQDIISKNLTGVATLEQDEQKTVNTQPVLAPVIPVSTSTSQPVQTAPKTQAQLNERISAIKTADVVLPKAANYKVLVGKYQTAEQAQLAKSIIRETSLGQNAFVKLIDNVYTIQIGSYSTAEQANSVAKELTTSSFPARVYLEKPQQNVDGEKTIF